MLSSFPHLTSKEFEQACSDLRQRYDKHGNGRQDDWQSVELVHSFDVTYLSITEVLPTDLTFSVDSSKEEFEQDELEEDDEEAPDTLRAPPAAVHYDVILSRVYRVPVLYFSISDLQHRYPPTMHVLYEYLIPPEFKAQAQTAGVIGGITINDHPITSRPVFFIHPCRTAEVMEASIGDRDIAPEEYLITWIGALGKCVGLNVPLALMQQDDSKTQIARDN
jgi:ubiquitin-like-conjugating enzyme ATG10